MCHMTCDTWHMTCDMRHMTGGGSSTLSPDFSSLALTDWEYRFVEEILTKEDSSVI